MNKALSFYMGETDNRGRTLNEILQWSDEQLEGIHDYIQWMFPSTEESIFNKEAPILDEETILVWRNSKELQLKIIDSVERYLIFLKRNTEKWVCSVDHNHLRITRMLKCMVTLGLEDQAENILKKLENIYKISDISESSIDYWRKAVYNTM